MEILVAESIRGKSLLVIDKFTFYKQRDLKNGEIFWRCTKKSLNCNAKVFTTGPDNKISRSQLTHNHQPDVSKATRQILCNSLKRKKAEEGESSETGDELANVLPSSISEDISYIRSNIYKANAEKREVLTAILDDADEARKNKAAHENDQIIVGSIPIQLKKPSDQSSSKKYVYPDNIKFHVKIVQRSSTETDNKEKMDTPATKKDDSCHVPKKARLQDDINQEILKALRSQKVEPDEDEAFFISVTPSVRKMSEENKLEFRMGVLQLIKDISHRNKDHLPSMPLLFSSATSSTVCHPSTSFSHYGSSNNYNSNH